ncbi:MAG: T9SS type A sorting domain-containing protein, partial [Nitrospirales bacterium]
MKPIALSKGLSLFNCLILFASIHAAGVTKPIGTFSSSGATNSTIYDNPNLQGVLVRARWKSIEPEPGFFDLSPLLSQVSAAEAHGKPWSLAVNGGGLGSPDWLFNQLDVPYIDYSFRGASGFRLPLFWDPMAQKRLKLLAERLAEEFSNNANLQLVYITQMTANGIEGHLNGIDMKVMRKAGFTEKKWIKASLQVAHTFATAFPDKALAFEVHELDHSATIPKLIMNKLWNHPAYNQRVGVAMWWISGKTHYQTDLIDALTTFPGDIYGQVIGRSDQTTRFEKEDYTSVFSQAKAIGMRYIEPWEFEFKYENRSAMGVWD